jgi:hypothetical protein
MTLPPQNALHPGRPTAPRAPDAASSEGHVFPFFAPKVNLTATGVATRSVAGDSGLNRIDSTPEIPMLDEVRE